MKNEMTVSGIKCDNENCDFSDMSVRYEDYKNWLNKPCPKCGCNLLTKKDYRILKIMEKIIKLSNLICKTDINQTTIHVKMNGTGTMEIDSIDF